jgi:hypothetical protein
MSNSATFDQTPAVSKVPHPTAYSTPPALIVAQMSDAAQ